MQTGVLLFGGSGGIGRALAQKLAAEGRQALLVGRDAARLEEAVAATAALPLFTGLLLERALFGNVAATAALTIFTQFLLESGAMRLHAGMRKDGR